MLLSLLEVSNCSPILTGIVPHRRHSVCSVQPEQVDGSAVRLLAHLLYCNSNLGLCYWHPLATIYALVSASKCIPFSILSLRVCTRPILTSICLTFAILPQAPSSVRTSPHARTHVQQANPHETGWVSEPTHITRQPGWVYDIRRRF